MSRAPVSARRAVRAGRGLVAVAVLAVAGPSLLAPSAAAAARPSASGSRASGGATPQAALTLVVSTTQTTAGGTVVLSTEGGSGSGAVSYAVVSATASGCAISGVELSASGPGTCVVEAAKAGDATYAPATSAPVRVTFTPRFVPPPLRVRPVTVRFGPRPVLGESDRRALGDLVTRLRPGSSVSLVARGPGDASARRARAEVVRRYLLTRVAVRVRIVLEVGGPASVLVVTTRV